MKIMQEIKGLFVQDRFVSYINFPVSDWITLEVRQPFVWAITCKADGEEG